MTFIAAIWIILINIIAWGFFHLTISYLCLIIPLNYFKKNLFWFRIFSWEKNGRLWNDLFRVKSWKKHLIDGSSIDKRSFNKTNLHGTKQDELIHFAAETKRAEMTHWLLLLPAPLFFLWNPIWAGWIMIIYAILINVPFIITQRYNRARIEAIIVRFTKKK